MQHRRISKCLAAFTLIELLAVIAVVVILAALAFPIFGRVQVQGYATKTLSNMRMMGVALTAYAGDNSFQLPGRISPQATGAAANKWPLLLQPYIQDLTIYGSPVPDVGGKSYKVTDPRDYLSNTTNYTSYIYNGGNDEPADATGATTYPRLNVIGLPSQTILLGVPLPRANNYYMDFTEGNNSDILNKKAFISGTPYVFADGSARSLAVDPAANNVAAPKSSGTYTDWLWLFDKSRTDIIH